jgi:hypothetical protein
MRISAVRALAGGTLMLSAAWLLGGCALLGGNTDEVCADAKQAFEQYMAQVKVVAANDPKQWKASTDKLAGQVEALSRQAEDAELKKALESEAKGLRAAATSLGTGDAGRLNTVITGVPQRVGAACD